MTDPFDWTGLWRKTADVFKKHGENIAATTIDDMDRAAAAYLRERIEAAFVPREQWEDLKRLHAENCGAYDRACAEREWLRERAGPYTGHCITCAEAAEAENVKLRNAIDRIWAEARDTEWHAGFNHAVALFSQALGGERE